MTKDQEIAYRHQVALAARRTLQRVVIPNISKVIPENERRLLATIDVEVTEHRSEFALAHAFVNNSDNREIEFGDGFMMLSYVMCQDYLVAYKLNELDAFGQFLSDTVQVSEENGERYVRGDSIIDTPPFLNYLHEPTQQITQAVAETSGPAVQMMIDNLTFIFAHELAHHVHGDTTREFPSGLTKAERISLIRREEAAADQYAIDVTTKTGALVMGAIPIMTLFAYSETDPDPDNFGDHPPAACRLRDMAEVAFPQIENQPDFAETLRKNPGAQEGWEASKRSLATLGSLLSGLCPN
ncbi:hypothetical protein GCM10009087_03050 [Sphingomonas oligophenolica]